VICGHDFYPTSVLPLDRSPEELTIADRVGAYRRFAAEWHARYGVDFWVAETSNLGLPVEQQREWLDALAGTLEAMRRDGLPVRGLCWYSRGDQFDWQTALVAPTGAVTRVGLFDQSRTPRPVAARFRTLARQASR
jgi:hypothetical protein